MDRAVRDMALAPTTSARHAAAMDDPIASPCVRVCIVDGQSGLCLGCFRSLKEVAGWARFTADEREALMAELPSRRYRVRPERVALFTR